MAPRRGSKATATETMAERPIIDMHTLRLPREEAARVETFKKLHRLPTGDLYVRLSVGEMLIYMMDNAKIAKDGNTRLLIDYETLSLVKVN